MALLSISLSWLSSSALATLWTRPEALALINHPLLIQIGTGRLQLGSFRRCTLAHTVVVEALESAVAGACSGNEVSTAATECLSLIARERQRYEEDIAAYLDEAASAGKSIALPRHEFEAGVRCYNCGGNHYNVDCPEELAPSSAAEALASYVRTARTLAPASVVIRDIAFAHATLAKAGLDGGSAYRGWVDAHATRWPALADACDGVLEAAGTLRGDEAPTAIEEARTARSLLFAVIDSEAGTAGLRDDSEDGDGGGACMTLQEAREELDHVEPGFLGQQDRNAQFVREQVLGATIVAREQKAAPSAAEKAAAYLKAKKAAAGGRTSGGLGATTAAAAPSSQKAEQSAVDKAAAYLKAKKAASGGKVSADAAAALMAAQGGPKQAAAKKYLALRRKQQAAAEYLAAKRQKEGSSDGTEGGNL